MQNWDLRVGCLQTELGRLEEHVETLRTFLMDMGNHTNQGAAGLVIDRDYLEIEFPLANVLSLYKIQGRGMRGSSEQADC